MSRWIGVAAVAMSGCEGGQSGLADAGGPAPGVNLPMTDGPESIVVAPLTISTAQADIDKGRQTFAAKGCIACHRPDDQKLVGPGLKGVTARRSVKWLQRMILRPEIMLQQDPVAKQLLATHFTPMPNQGVNPDTELPAIMAYLKSLE